MDIKITQESLPVIHINYDEVKSNLIESMGKYQNIVVSEDTLADCKATQRELNKLSKQIDTYRKDKKKEFSAPIKEFEGQCKELIAIIDDVLLPIKEGISVFDEKKKAEKKASAEAIIREMAEASKLSDKFKSRIELKKEYCNLSATTKAVRNDVQYQISYLEMLMNAEEEKRKGIQACIDEANKHITKKVSVEDFERYIDLDLPDIIKEVNRTVDLIYVAEHPEPEEPVEGIKEKPVPRCDATVCVKHIKNITIAYEFTGDEDKINHYIDRMRADGIEIEPLAPVEDDEEEDLF